MCDISGVSAAYRFHELEFALYSLFVTFPVLHPHTRVSQNASSGGKGNNRNASFHFA